MTKNKPIETLATVLQRGSVAKQPTRSAELVKLQNTGEVKVISAKLFDIADKYKFCCSRYGHFVDSVSNKKMKINHVRCLFRKDLKEIHDCSHISSGTLSLLVEVFLCTLVKLVAKVLDNEIAPGEKFKMLSEVKDEFLEEE